MSVVQSSAGTTTSVDNATDWTVVFPSPLTVGNRVVVAISANVALADTDTAPNGGSGATWTLDASVENGPNCVKVYSRPVASGDGTTFGFGHTTTGSKSGIMNGWEADDTGAATDTEPFVGSGNSVTYASALAVDGAGQLIVCCHRTNGDDGGAFTCSNLSATDVYQNGSAGGAAWLVTPDDTDVTPNPAWVTARSNAGVAVVYAVDTGEPAEEEDAIAQGWGTIRPQPAATGSAGYGLGAYGEMPYGQ